MSIIDEMNNLVIEPAKGDTVKDELLATLQVINN